MAREELEKLWDRVLGRYTRAVQNLIVSTLQESQSAVEKLSTAISQMRTPESSITAALTIKKVMIVDKTVSVSVLSVIQF